MGVVQLYYDNGFLTTSEHFDVDEVSLWRAQKNSAGDTTWLKAVGFGGPGQTNAVRDGSYLRATSDGSTKALFNLQTDNVGNAHNGRMFAFVQDGQGPTKWCSSVSTEVHD